MLWDDPPDMPLPLKVSKDDFLFAYISFFNPQSVSLVS